MTVSKRARWAAAISTAVLIGVGVIVIPMAYAATRNVNCPGTVNDTATTYTVTTTCSFPKPPAATVTVTVTATPSPPTPSPTPTASPTPTVSPTPTPTPTPSPTPTTPPPSGAFPDASNTGVPAGTTLTAYTGPSNITVAGTVIDGKTLGCIEVSAPGVTIRNSRISCRPSYAVVSVDDRVLYSKAPLLLEDVEIDCQNGPGHGVGEAHVTARRVNVHGCENGFDANQSITVEDSYIHDLWNGGDAHMDGIQLSSHWNGSAYVQGSLNVTIRHNTIFGVDPSGALGTSAIISNPKGDANIIIDGNLLGGGAYTLYCDYSAKGAGYMVTGNRFTRRFSSKYGAFGSSDGCSDEALSGNVDHETGLPLQLN